MIDSNLKIVDNAVYGINNKKIDSIEIPDGITEIAFQAFYGCFDLKEVHIPDSVQSIGIGAFLACSSLKSIKLPSKLKSIEEKTFYGCKSLEEIRIPDGVEIIDANAFYGCLDLKSAYIPASVHFICDDAFNACPKLKDFSIDKNNMYYIIEDGVLYGRNKKTIIKVFDVKELTIDKHVEYISLGALRECVHLEKIEVDKENARFTTSDGILYSKNLERLYRVPSMIDEEKYIIEPFVREIGHYAFSNCKAIKSIEMSNAVKLIDSYAFSNCCSLQNIQLSDRIEILEEGAFMNCIMLHNITLPKNLTAIKENAFNYCHNLQSIVFNEILKCIDSYSFLFCASLDNVILPNSVSEIGQGAFCKCFKLKTVVLPTNLQNIENELFKDCKSLDYIELPESTLSIGNRSFSGCESLEEIEFPSNVTIIEQNSFEGCSLISKLILPASINKIGTHAFCGCKSLKSVEFQNNKINDCFGIFKDCHSLKDVTFRGETPLNFIKNCFSETDTHQITLHVSEDQLHFISKHLLDKFKSIIIADPLDSIEIQEKEKHQKETSPTKKRQETKQPFICCIPGKKLNQDKLWKWIIDEFCPKITASVEWVAIYTLLYHNNCLLTERKYKVIYEETEERLKGINVKIHPKNNLNKFNFIITSPNWFDNDTLVPFEDFIKSINEYKKSVIESSVKDLSPNACLNIYNTLKAIKPIFNINDFLEVE